MVLEKNGIVARTGTWTRQNGPGPDVLHDMIRNIEFATEAGTGIRAGPGPDGTDRDRTVEWRDAIIVAKQDILSKSAKKRCIANFARTQSRDS